jgi:excisionase family DNA binding protein
MLLKMSPKAYATREAAKTVGISRATLQAWIKSGKVRAPEPTEFGGGSARLWSESDVARLRRAKEKLYMKDLGRPKKKR